jgi:hypothetical protein
MSQMEQERLERQGVRRNLGRLQRGDQNGAGLSQTVDGGRNEEVLDAGQERLSRMQRERSYGSSHVGVGGGDTEHLDSGQEHSIQLECDRPDGLRHVDDGGGEAFRLNQWDQRDLNKGDVTKYRTLGAIRSSPGIHRQYVVNENLRGRSPQGSVITVRVPHGAPGGERRRPGISFTPCTISPMAS